MLSATSTFEGNDRAEAAAAPVVVVDRRHPATAIAKAAAASPANAYRARMARVAIK
jgi:hypothetical protein